jgi:glutathione S-transferase
MYELYTINGSCSNGIAYFFNYMGLPFLDKPRADHRAALEAMNPAASVPTLVSDFGPLTESGAILLTLAQKHAPDLLGETDDQKRRVLETLFFLNSTFYYGFIPYFRPEKYAASPAAQAEVKTAALSQISEAAHRLKQMTSSEAYLVGDNLTVCDFIGLVYLNWLSKVSPEILEASGLAPIYRNLSNQSFTQPAKALATA